MTEQLSPAPGLSPTAERHLLQIVIAVAGFVPVGGGLAGAILGSSMTSEMAIGLSLDSHVRYLSGLLLGIGLAFWDCIPQIEHRTERVRVLTAIVALGGMIRLIGVIFVGVPGIPMCLAVVMEIVVTPVICLWQTRVARRLGALP